MEDKDILMHHGVAGMRWGHRKNNQASDNRTFKQKKYDERMYGKRGSKQIGKRIAKGEGIRSARHVEVVKKPKIKRVKNIAKGTAQIAAGAGLLGASIVSSLSNVQIVNLTRRTKGRINPATNEAINYVATAASIPIGGVLLNKGMRNIKKKS